MENRRHTEEHAVQRILNSRLVEFLDNDWPHTQRLLGSLKARVDLMVWLLGLLVTLSGGLVVRLWLS